MKKMNDELKEKRTPVTVQLSEECIRYLEYMREKGYIKSRIVERAITDYMKHNKGYEA